MAKRRDPRHVLPQALLDSLKLGYTVQAGSAEGSWPTDQRPAPQPKAAPLPARKGRAK